MVGKHPNPSDGVYEESFIMPAENVEAFQRFMVSALNALGYDVVFVDEFDDSEEL